jgi:hypothetical protein
MHLSKNKDSYGKVAQKKISLEMEILNIVDFILKKQGEFKTRLISNKSYKML